VEGIDSQSRGGEDVFCKHLNGKMPFTVMLRLYAAIHREMRDSVLQEQEESTVEFREQRRRKRNHPEEQAKRSKTTIMPTPGKRDLRIRFQGEIPTRNFFASMRGSEVEVECTLLEKTTDKPNRELQQPPSSKSGRPPPIVLTSTANLMQLQGISKAILSSATPEAGPELSQKKWRIFHS
jgi:hypothetical protein